MNTTNTLETKRFADFHVPTEISKVYPNAPVEQIGKVIALKIAAIMYNKGRVPRPTPKYSCRCFVIVRKNAEKEKTHTWVLSPPGMFEYQLPNAWRLEVTTHEGKSGDHLVNNLRSVIECLNF